MPKKDTFIQDSKDGLTVIAYPGMGSVLLAFDLDGKPDDDLAGFAIHCTPPNGEPYYLPNRINFTSPITRKTKPAERRYTSSNHAPFQKFRWVYFPPEIKPGTYRYEVSTMHFSGNELRKGLTVPLALEMAPEQYPNFDIGFTRGYLSSQAYAERFHNASIRPTGAKTIDFDTAKYQAQYEWLGFTARKMIFDFLRETAVDPTLTLDVFAYDIDEPDIIASLAKLGNRLRIFTDNAKLHTGAKTPESLVRQRLVQSAGADRVRAGHFGRFAHNKVLIQKKNGVAVKVLAGSANFSIRGLYVQANNVYVFNDPYTAGLYEEAFEQAFQNPSKFASAAIADRFFDIQSSGCPVSQVAFSPHKDPGLTLDTIAREIDAADSSVFFAIMEMRGGGAALDSIRKLDKSQIFTYGVTQSRKGLSLFPPGSKKGAIMPFGYLNDKVPEAFQKEWGGGPGQVVHHKFVVVDFNDSRPVLFTGSSNLAAGGEKANGDNLIAVYDRGIATAFAVEALRLLDHYHFRDKMKSADPKNPLELSGPDAKQKWWAPYYDPENIKYNDRLLFSRPARK